MRDYGKVYSTFWSSKTVGALGDDAKMLALYLMTCTHSTIIASDWWRITRMRRGWLRGWGIFRA